MRVYFNVAGLICFCARRYAFHFLVERAFWVWGWSRDLGYSVTLYEFGLGPFLLVVYTHG